MGQIEDLRLFVTIVDVGSISKAAEKLRIVKSAVSRRLGLLEDRYGSRLIDRAPGAWQVTTAGLELYQRAVQIVGEADEIESDFSEATQSIAGALNISLPRDFGTAFLKDALMSFQKCYPEILLTIDFDDRITDMARENYDFSIRVTPKLKPDVTGKQIGTTRHQLCASPEYLAVHGCPETLQELRRHHLLHFGTAKRVQWNFQESSGKTHSIEFQPAMNSNSGVFLLESAVNGLGIAWLPDFICQSALSAGTLIPILADFTVAEWGIFLIHAEGRRLNRRMRLFSQAMEKACLPNNEVHVHSSLPIK